MNDAYNREKFAEIVMSTNTLLKKQNHYENKLKNISFYPHIQGLYRNLEITYAEFIVEYCFSNSKIPSKKINVLADRIIFLRSEILNIVNQ